MNITPSSHLTNQSPRSPCFLIRGDFVFPCGEIRYEDAGIQQRQHSTLGGGRHNGGPTSTASEGRRTHPTMRDSATMPPRASPSGTSLAWRQGVSNDEVSSGIPQGWRVSGSRGASHIDGEDISRMSFITGRIRTPNHPRTAVPQSVRNDLFRFESEVLQKQPSSSMNLSPRGGAQRFEEGGHDEEHTPITSTTACTGSSTSIRGTSSSHHHHHHHRHDRRLPVEQDKVAAELKHQQPPFDNDNRRGMAAAVPGGQDKVSPCSPPEEIRDPSSSADSRGKSMNLSSRGAQQRFEKGGHDEEHTPNTSTTCSGSSTSIRGSPSQQHHHRHDHRLPVEEDKVAAESKQQEPLLDNDERRGVTTGGQDQLTPCSPPEEIRDPSSPTNSRGKSMNLLGLRGGAPQRFEKGGHDEEHTPLNTVAGSSTRSTRGSLSQQKQHRRNHPRLLPGEVVVELQQQSAPLLVDNNADKRGVATGGGQHDQEVPPSPPDEIRDPPSPADSRGKKRPQEG